MSPTPNIGEPVGGTALDVYKQVLEATGSRASSIKTELMLMVERVFGSRSEIALPESAGGTGIASELEYGLEDINRSLEHMEQAIVELRKFI